MKKRIKVLRIITRLNIGGPSIHVSLLTRGLDPEQFESLLISGSVSEREGDMSYVPARLGVSPLIIPSLKREIDLSGDLRCLFRLIKILSAERPDIVHTHTAKAGTMGRIAVFVHNKIHRNRILVVHTFHGHVLHGYFSRTKSRLFLWAERLLASITDIIIAISKSQRLELAETYRLGNPAKFRIVKLGFDLDAFSATAQVRGEFRSEIGVDGECLLIGIVGRLVSIKNHSMFLNAARLVTERGNLENVRFVVVGDGELREELMDRTVRLGIADYVIFCGWKRDLPKVYADLDLLVLTSINEGTPVSIIEAMASSVPVIATDAGGVRDLLGPVSQEADGYPFQVCLRGLLCRQNDAAGLADATCFLLSNGHIREQITRRARDFVFQYYTEERLLRDIESLYFELLRNRASCRVQSRKPSHALEPAPVPLKVLQVYKDYYPPVIGGVEGHINLLANGLKARGVDVEVLVSNTCPRLEIQEIDGIRVTKAPQVGRFASAPLNATFSSWLSRLGKTADIVHFHFPNPTGEISSLLAGLNSKVVVTYHSDIVRQARMAKLYAPFLREFLSRAKIVIATSPNYVESSEILKKFKEKCKVIPFGIDLTRFNLDEDLAQEAQAIRRDYGDRIVLFIGRFRYYKGLYVLIEAMKRVMGTLLLIGSGPMENDLKKQVHKDAELRRRVFFLGELGDTRLVAHLYACDLFVLPSILRSEAFGIVLLEAMACGRPIVSTELGTGTSFVNLDGETGLVVPPNNAPALARAINFLLEHPEKRNQYGRAGRRRAEECFSLDRMVDDVLNVYRQIVR